MSGNSIKKLNILVNADLKCLVNWLNANKISLNVKKTEIVIFKSKQKKFGGDLKIKLSGKRLHPSESVKYLGLKIDTNLSWQYRVNDLSFKLNRANALIFKMTKNISCKILRSIYFAIFDSYLSYCCLVWAQNYWFSTKELSYQSPIQTKLHLKTSRKNLPRKYFICQEIFK